MNWFLAFGYLAILGFLAFVNWNELLFLAYVHRLISFRWLNTGSTDGYLEPCVPKNNEALRQLRMRLIYHNRGWFALALYLLLVLHLYDSDWAMLEADREDALAKGPPYGCSVDEPTESAWWHPLIAYVVAYTPCQMWHYRIQHRWPNLGHVLTEAPIQWFFRQIRNVFNLMGECISDFLSHFPWRLQLLFVICAAVFIFIWPFRAALLSWIPHGTGNSRPRRNKVEYKYVQPVKYGRLYED